MGDISIQTVLFAAAGGVIPTFVWLWFWLSRQDSEPEPAGLLFMTFIAGMLAVLVLLPLKPYVQAIHLSAHQITVFYAGLEEFAKVTLVALIAFSTRVIDEPTDYTIYLITGGLGFSALENTLYLLNPLLQGNDLGSIVISGNLRFLGATVLHSVTVALAGVIIGLAFPLNKFSKFIYGIIGIAMGTGLHSAFNYFIMQNTRQGTIIAIAGIWVTAVIVIILFDRLRTYRTT